MNVELVVDSSYFADQTPLGGSSQLVNGRLTAERAVSGPCGISEDRSPRENQWLSGLKKRETNARKRDDNS